MSGKGVVSTNNPFKICSIKKHDGLYFCKAEISNKHINHLTKNNNHKLFHSLTIRFHVVGSTDVAGLTFLVRSRNFFLHSVRSVGSVPAIPHMRLSPRFLRGLPRAAVLSMRSVLTWLIHSELLLTCPNHRSLLARISV